MNDELEPMPLRAGKSPSWWIFHATFNAQILQSFTYRRMRNFVDCFDILDLRINHGGIDGSKNGGRCRHVR